MAKNINNIADGTEHAVTKTKLKQQWIGEIISVLSGCLNLGSKTLILLKQKK